ncbi:hypothetical protein K474DRAFT_1635344 [Panus rudis PR-1116 ss-1]|nr:hypothetical protein K474DRAFT_1635344 [Panus rudis PR-1116 ss-1]
MGMMIPSRDTPGSPTEQVRALMAQKEAIETEIEAQHSILKANHTNLTEPLVDAEGFPRNDIDIWAVRHARVRIIELRNDYKSTMDSIAVALQSVYDPSRAPPEPAPSTTQREAPASLLPFARVDGVAPNSPAAAAGLLREDLILSFGTLTKSSFPASSLQPLADFVGRRENVLLRASEEVNLTLTPRRWGGRGLLG